MHIALRSQEDPTEPDPLALDPYSPIVPAPKPDDGDPLALDPYSPVVWRAVSSASIGRSARTVVPAASRAADSGSWDGR